MRGSDYFGRELRRRRLAAGITLEGLAARVHYSKGQLSKVERGIKAPGRDLAALCDRALVAEGSLIASAFGTSGRELDEGVRASGRGAVGRRTAIAVGATVAAGAVSLARGAGESARSVGSGGSPAAPAALRAMFEQYRVLGQTLDPRFVLPGLVAQARSVTALCRQSAGASRDELLLLGSRYAEYVGWLMQEAGDDEAAGWWTGHAVEMAAAAGDRDLAAYAFVRQALMSLYRDDPATTVGLARQAQGRTLPDRIRGLAAQREAQGHALAGDRDSTMRSLDRARIWLDRATGDGPPTIGTTHLRDPVAMATGWCLYDLGRPEESAEVIGAQLALLPSGALRNQVRFGMRLALACASAGDLDQSCSVARQLLETTEVLCSATVAIDVRRLIRTLSRHPTHPEVRSLLPELSTSTPNTATRPSSVSSKERKP